MRHRQLIHITRTTLLCFSMLAACAIPLTARAQAQPAPAVYQPMDDQQIDSLTAPIALYPDALLSEIFVAATYPLQVVEASQWLAAGNSPANVDSQPWDPSVKGLTRFPSVLNQMASNAAWTNDLGAAFLNQQAQVFASVQRLRAQAIAAGTLYSTPQQQVVKDGGTIEIIPADPQTIYLPTYDPDAVYYPQDIPPGTAIAPLVSFDYSCPVGPWLCYDADWDDSQVYFGNWGVDRPWWHWRDHPDWHYRDYRPGHYAGHGFGGDHGAYVPHAWTHDTHIQGPRFQPLPVIRNDRHVPLARPDAVPEIDRGAAAERDAARGRAERAREAAPGRTAPRETPIERETSPVRETPAHQEAPPVREAPPGRRETPPARETPPERREAPPVREEPARAAPTGGGAMDYGRGDDAARAASRGNESRGGGGGGGGHAGHR